MAGRVRVRFVPDEAGIQRLLLSPGMASVALRAAMEGKAHAEGLAASFAESGTYQRSFVVKTRRFPKMGDMGMRMGAVLINEAPYAASLEFKKGGHRVLTQTKTWLASEFDSEGK